MRTIKFRMWTGKEMKNVDVMALSPCAWDCPDHGKSGVSLAYQPSIKVMQFTGLHDKNGKEIYEGDIVNHTSTVRTGTRRRKIGRSYESYAIREKKEIIGVVKEGEYLVGIRRKKIPCFVVDSDMETSYDSYFYGSGKRNDKPTKISQSLTEPLYSDKEYEVIGNIYENPELLKEETK